MMTIYNVRFKMLRYGDRLLPYKKTTRIYTIVTRLNTCIMKTYNLTLHDNVSPLYFYIVGRGANWFVIILSDSAHSTVLTHGHSGQLSGAPRS